VTDPSAFWYHEAVAEDFAPTNVEVAGSKAALLPCAPAGPAVNLRS
jgi:hypothetical protein